MAEITKEIWLKLGLKLLDQEGLGALKIARLCQELAVTKGSFYHWFGSKLDFDMAVLHLWREIFTEEFIQNAEIGVSSQEKLKRLIINCIDSLKVESRLEIEINIWAHQEPLIGSFVKEVYTKRFTYLIELLEDIYFNKIEAKRHALILYSLIIGVELFYQKLTRKELEAVFLDYL
jgi:AcrR family transcriptional regulator